MRHGKKFNHLGRTYTHRRAMLSNMACSLILNKRIFTTVPKAKALRKFVEPILTRGKSSSTHVQRQVFSRLSHNKEAVKELFSQVSDKIATRMGGYTRIIKLQKRRLGDNADMCLMELVDYSVRRSPEAAEGETTAKKRTRRGGGKAPRAGTPQEKASPQVAVSTAASVPDEPSDGHGEAPGDAAVAPQPPEKKE